MKYLYSPDYPIDKVLIGCREIEVARCDLVPYRPLPPYLKTIELIALASYLKESVKPTCMAFYSQDVSEWTVCFPSVCAEAGLPGIIGFAKKKKIPEFVQCLGESVYWLTPNMYKVNYFRMKKVVEANGGYMLPIGVEHPVVVDTIANYFNNSPLPDSDVYIVPCGSGVSLCGILRHLVGRRCLVVGSCTRATKSVASVVRRCFGSVFGDIELRLVEGTKILQPMPFPGHSYWEGQTWSWLINNVSGLSGSVCYINLGDHTPLDVLTYFRRQTNVSAVSLLG